MTRNGKIARLPAEIREKLNRRLENGEAGVRLIEWLNGLPEVKAVIQTDFEGVAISEMNLSQWKNGGFLDWQARQEARAVMEEWRAESPMPGAGGSGVEGRGDGAAASGEVAEVLIEQLLAHYVCAVRRTNGKPDEEPEERLQRLGKSLRDIVRLGRYELARERAALERERIELQRVRLNAQARGANKGDDEEAERLSHLEKAEMVKQMLEDA